MKYSEIELKTEDGEKLHCFSLKHNHHDPYYKNKTVVLLGPNAGNVSHYLSIAEIFFKSYGYNVFAYSYRGYGRSTGTPNEAGLKCDARAVLNYLAEDSQFSASRIILYGRSLGGAVAIYMASLASQYPESSEVVHTNGVEPKESFLRRRNIHPIDRKNAGHKMPKVSGVILENTFLCIPKVIPYIFPMLKYVSVLCHDKWLSEKDILLIDAEIPVLFLNGLKDEIVPPEHMQTLFDLAPSNKKFIHLFQSGYHNDTCNQPNYWDIIYEFAEDID